MHSTVLYEVYVCELCSVWCLLCAWCVCVCTEYIYTIYISVFRWKKLLSVCKNSTCNYYNTMFSLSIRNYRRYEMKKLNVEAENSFTFLKSNMAEDHNIITCCIAHYSIQTQNRWAKQKKKRNKKKVVRAKTTFQKNIIIIHKSKYVILRTYIKSIHVYCTHLEFKCYKIWLLRFLFLVFL